MKLRIIVHDLHFAVLHVLSLIQRFNTTAVGYSVKNIPVLFSDIFTKWLSPHEDWSVEYLHFHAIICQSTEIIGPHKLIIMLVIIMRQSRMMINL